MADRTLTSLEIARRIADAVLVARNDHKAASRASVPSELHAPTQAVMTTLRDLDLWFCSHIHDP